jgi:hypothetical protein
MGRSIARVGGLVLIVAITLVFPGQPVLAQQQKQATSDQLVNATSWALLSVAQLGKKNAMAIGYSRAPSTAPVGFQWNGSTWTATPMPHPSGGALLYSATAVPGTVHYLAGGESCTTVACPEAFMVEWDGTSWSPVKLPPLSGSTDIASVSASSANDAWAAGQSCNDLNGSCNVLLLHWNGKTWSKMTIPRLADMYADLYSVADLSPTNAWAVGTSEFGSLALHWNGSSWVDVPVPGNSGFNQGIDAVAAIPGTSEIWALEAASGGQLMLKWNGSEFLGVGLPARTRNLADFEFTDVAASSTTNAWDVGYALSGSGTEPSLTAQWNSRKWSVVASPNAEPANELFGVETSSATSAFAVGVGYSPFQETASGLLLQWDGTSWSKVKLPSPKVPSGATPRAGRLTEGRSF